MKSENVLGRSEKFMFPIIITAKPRIMAITAAMAMRKVSMTLNRCRRFLRFSAFNGSSGSFINRSISLESISSERGLSR